MRTILAVGMAVGLAAFLSAPAKAGAPAPAPAAAPAGGGLFVESEDGAVSKLTISGEVYNRYEFQKNMQDFNSETNDNEDWGVSRIRLGLAFQLNDDVEVFLQPQGFYVWGGQNGQNSPGTAAADRDSLDVYQAFVTLHPEVLGMESALKIGRQELAFGSEMLLGNNTRYSGLSWDALRLDVKPAADLTTTLFAAKIVENDATSPLGTDDTSANPGGRNDVHLFGWWNTYTGFADTTVDFYALALQGESDNVNVATGYDDGTVYTLGARVKIDEIDVVGNVFDFSAEIATQVGEIDTIGAGDEDLDVKDCYAFEAELGYKLPLVWSPRAAIGLAWASGTDGDADGESNTFNPLFEDSGGARLGEADVFQLSNIRCFYASLTMKPMDSEKVTTGIAYYRFEAMHVEDDIGNTGITSAGSDNDVADEIDLFVDYAMSKNVGMRATYGMVDPADVIRDQLANSPASRLFLTLNVKW